MALIRVGGLWKQNFKSGRGFSGSLDNEKLEQYLQDNPSLQRTRIMVFDNAEGKDQNEKAPDFNIVIATDDGNDRGGRRGGRNGGDSQRERDDSRRDREEPEPRGRSRREEPADDPDKDPFDDGRGEKDAEEPPKRTGRRSRR